MAYKIQISANSLHWPKHCACCCAPSSTTVRASASRTTGKRVRNTTTSWWDVPYCSKCVEHKNLHNSANLWLGGFAVVSLIVLFNGGGGASVVLMAIGIAIFLFIRKSAKAKMVPTCSCPSDSVKYLYWHGTFHTFVFSSELYLQLFLNGNNQKKRSDITTV